MNVITITGNLGKDCESRFLPNGDAVTSFSVADSQGRDKPSIWWNCSLFGKRGEALAQYLIKGQTVTVIGNITEREWADKDGHKRKAMDIRVQDLALQGGRPGSQPARTEGYQGGTGQRDTRPALDRSFEDSDIPF